MEKDIERGPRTHARASTSFSQTNRHWCKRKDAAFVEKAHRADQKALFGTSQNFSTHFN